MSLDLDKYFLNNSIQSIDTYTYSMQKALKIISYNLKNNEIFSAKAAKDLEKIANQFDIDEYPNDISIVLEEQLNDIFKHSLNVNSPKSMAHLHCPVMVPSLVAETFISALNQSMDSWDQSPIATYIEQHIINWLSLLIYNDNNLSDGVFTSGGTQSNLMGLLLARDHFCKSTLNHKVADKGLPDIANRFRVLCTEKTHFSVHKSLALLGLGKNSIEIVNTDDNLQLDTQNLTIRISTLKAQNLIPICIVTTVGDTDFGCIDNIKEIAEIANDNNIWLHADAAVGGALLLSDKHKYRLDGLELVDSVTVDFHKLFFQPISCGAFFCKDKSILKLLSYHADYLNPDKDGFDTINLVDKSIQTTRRFDALKLSIALKCSGTKLFSEWINHIIETTTKSIKTVSEDKNLQLAFKETQHLNNSLNTIVFRYFDENSNQETLNTINSKIHKATFHSGNFAIAQTKVNRNTYLKITLVNPMITLELVTECLNKIKLYGNLFKNQIGVNNDD
ncbi:aspartate aminotransferase family protein [Allofrancisella guangzhouensis]|uniref:Diaminobutyrate decarboxylase n=1 Tax=Allofrancisella guangzhouensis TaxID=594679 RepID=A0A0A8E3A4_9GAMM|nr:aspartate aminotransferase family protein [Allofrancisella guangzhouensis]AJC48488.1 diaminobutyrate decarboxylase [Allofrancisella guangzhouensis]MBK2027607.1 aspartate aminotransferase family protein [Allofrancisella guangzhouensis]MBK2044080.1 aspartate aminotransferase family protein [Allofrancisella guangzhouensis]MBK2046528.1 aspartate aminotransferase family protein [Allofrancisella guangzhouensis]